MQGAGGVASKWGKTKKGEEEIESSILTKTPKYDAVVHTHHFHVTAGKKARSVSGSASEAAELMRALSQETLPPE